MSNEKKIVSIDELRRKAAERGDSLESLSPADLEKLTEELRKELGDLPDVRMDRVALAKARISKGFYTGERIADGILSSLRGPTPPDPMPLHPDFQATESEEDAQAREGAHGNEEPSDR
ncbi:MAG: flagellar biosynthesis anti-sigma factor FlgM [Candidatus Eisenbacteria bacterium]|uniref:Flagellar biosynthesis anti-sigma factor FlgM n=1 Tax=Eiseniibacteriota bacterium TaxID=2212470 RepID=A0A956NCG1_UNCEI|nr:flagellar biosynthesis anti-sigma factor FlgM [Candidatus Eisenbacteria bacterium]MCB9466370.1 flagellar biosynthesis anti-sigma factor FlgM [Candidatus Eisenbacteria bacterium]